MSMEALRQIAMHRIVMLGWGVVILSLFGWMLTTNPPHEVIFAFVSVFGGLVMILAYQQGHSDAVRWAASLLPDDPETQKPSGSP